MSDELEMSDVLGCGLVQHVVKGRYIREISRKSRE